MLKAELQQDGWRNGESRMFQSCAQEQRLRGWRGRGLCEGVQVFQYICSIRGHVQEWQKQDRKHKCRLFHKKPFLSCKMFLLVCSWWRSLEKPVLRMTVTWSNWCLRKSLYTTYGGWKVMTNLDSILESRDITLPTKVCLVKAMVFPVVMYGCESWTVKKAECQKIDAFELWFWRRLLRVPWTARRSNQSILKEISPGY